MVGTPASLEQILANKERRAFKQQELLSRHLGYCLISLSINTPSSIKCSHEALVIYECAYEEIVTLLNKNNVDVGEIKPYIAITGAEALFTCKADAKSLKILTCKLENEHPLGRMMDFDVFDEKGILLSRTEFNLPKRRCLMCKKEAHQCAREQTHDYHTLNEHIKKMVHTHAFDVSMALWCERAMRKEVELTPKPGLVDSANSGAHNDMDIKTFYASIHAIKPFLKQYIQTAQSHAHEDALSVFSKLRSLGIVCERAMFESTHGVNTHKGMIFSLAVMCGALGVLYAQKKEFTCKNIQTQMALLCQDLVNVDLLKKEGHSAGARFFYETGNSGIRGIAQSGFALVCEGSLPFYEEKNENYGEEQALKLTLLWLMAHLEDSTLWSRGGIEGLHYVKSRAKSLLESLPNTLWSLDAKLEAFNNDMTKRHLSPGGSADLLAMTWLMAQIVKS